MSAESRPSFRAYFKEKIKQSVKPNITSSIRERLISNETYQHVRDKYHNLTEVAKNRTGFSNLVNKTKSLLPGVFSSKDNETSPKGFYDSLFSTQTDEGVYFKVAIICLWAIAILCIIPTIITIFIPTRGKPSNTRGVKMIFFHIFLCELCYLIYILLSMINVAQSFQLNTVLCDFANYGMYITIPVMHFALLFLSLERITKLCGNAMTWTKIFTKPYVIQVVLVAIWLIFIAAITTIMMLRKQFSLKSIASRASEFAPPIFSDITKKVISPYRCSIDGRLSAVFKVLFIVLFCILMVLIIKSVVLSIFYKFFTPTCCTSNGVKKKLGDFHMTILYALFLFLNVFFSFPFYFISITHSIFTSFSSTKDAFSTKLKICLLLRLTSIILQCIAFAIIESNSWNLFSRLLFYGTCKRVAALNKGVPYTKKPTTSKTKPRVNTRTESDDANTNASENEDSLTKETDDDDEVFIEESRNKLLKTKRVTEVSSAEDDSGAESPLARKPRRATETKKVVEHTRQKKNRTPVTKSVSKRTSTEKSHSQRTPPATTDRQASKSRTNQSNAKPRPAKRSSSSDATSDVRVEPDVEVKPSTTIRKEPHATRSSSNEPKRMAIVVSHEQRSQHERQRTKRSPASRAATSNRSKHQHTTERRRRSPRNTNQRSAKSSRDRSRKIQDQSDDV